MCENWHGKKWLKLKVYIVNRERNVHYFKFFTPRSAANTIQKVRRTVSAFVQVQRGRRDNTILHRQKHCLVFETIFLVFLNHKTHSGLKNEAFSTRRLCEWRRREHR